MKFTPEQVIEMARGADPEHFYPDEKLFDDEIAFLERLCTLAADRALEAAAAKARPKEIDVQTLIYRLRASIAWLERGESIPGASVCIGLNDIKALKTILEGLA